MSSSYQKQIRTVLLIEIALFCIISFILYYLWDKLCQNSLSACLVDDNLSTSTFIALSIIRPFIFTPIEVFALIAGGAYGPYMGTLLVALCAVSSSALLFFIGKAIGKKIISPWLKRNLPETLNFFRSQDWKIIFILRLIPFFPFDLLSLSAGLLDFRSKQVLAATFVGSLPQLYIFSQIAKSDSSLLVSIFKSILMTLITLVIPIALYEYRSRKKGSSLWKRLKAMWSELKAEIKFNNSIIKRHEHNPEKIPVLLLYGFFSSRRSLTVLEKILSNRGYEVISFNLGGLLGVFFTRGIIETANFLDYKLARQFKRHNLAEINIVAHSKGGLVATWWLLKLGGYKHCKKLITLGTPYKGTQLSWIALFTPIGLIFKDVWQMRPGSDFIKKMHSLKIPKQLTIYNIYSYKDRVATGKIGCFEPTDKDSQVTTIPMHHIAHFEFLYRREIGEILSKILGSPYSKDHNS